MKRLLKLHQILITTVTILVAFQKIDEVVTHFRKRFKKDEEEDEKKESARSKIIVIGD